MRVIKTLSIVSMASAFLTACGDTAAPGAGGSGGTMAGAGGATTGGSPTAGTGGGSSTSASVASSSTASSGDASSATTTGSSSGSGSSTGSGGSTNPGPLAVSHVLLLSIDGMHEIDLANFIAKNPTSALASLAKTGVHYSKAYVNNLDGTPQNPSDSFPGLLALTTGASSPTHGGWYDVSYARDLYTDSTCTVKGTMAAFDEGIEVDNSGLWGNGKLSGPTHNIVAARLNIDTAKLPWQKTQAGCTPVYAHNFIRVNTIFEVAHDAGMHTAWSDKHLTYEMVSGPTGNGVDDFFAPEINSLASNLPMPAGVVPGATDDFTTNFKFTKVYDDYKVQAIINQIDGKWSDTGLVGAVDTANQPGVIPAIFGMNFQAVSVAQKDARPADMGGYSDAAGTPNADLADAIAHTDASIGKMVAELAAKGALDSTLIIVSAKHGQSPIDHSIVARRDGDKVAALMGTNVAGHIEDDVGLYWLNDQTQAAAAVTALGKGFTAGSDTDPNVDTIYTSASANFTAMFGDPAIDPRTPDVIVKPKVGTIYSTSAKKWAEHGGFAEDDSHVALLVSNPSITGATVTTPVRTKQVAPTILASLCLDPTALEGVQKEGTAVLPTLSFPACSPAPGPMRWTASAPPVKATINGGPWTVAQLQAGLAAVVPPETYVFGTKLKHLNAGYCTTWGNPTASPPVLGVMATNPGVAPMSPYYWPMVVGSGMTLQGFFDWRDKDTNEAIVAARSTDGGKTWTWQQTAMYLTMQCPASDTQTNPELSSDGVTSVVDDGYGHSFVFDVGGVSRLYALDRSFKNIDSAGLVVFPLNVAGTPMSTTTPLANAPVEGPIEGAGLTRTVGLRNPDGIFAVVPGTSNPTIVMYLEKQLHGAALLPASQVCPDQPYPGAGAKAGKGYNDDIVTARLASTMDGVNFIDLGAVNGLSDYTTTSFLGTRYVAGGGTMLQVDATHYGLFFSGGNCMDADSDSFHYVGYAESTDLVNWTVINGINNPIASIGTEVLKINGVMTQIPAQTPVVGAAQRWFAGRVYSPSINKLDATHVSMSFAGYGVQTPNNGLEDYRQVGNVVLTASRALP